jgi:hypothetical protein
VFHTFLQEGSPYSILFRITCNEGKPITKRIAHVVPA